MPVKSTMPSSSAVSIDITSTSNIQELMVEVGKGLWQTSSDNVQLSLLRRPKPTPWSTPPGYASQGHASRNSRTLSSSANFNITDTCIGKETRVSLKDLGRSGKKEWQDIKIIISINIKIYHQITIITTKSHDVYDAKDTIDSLQTDILHEIFSHSCSV